jgi:hypothetical protein
MSPKVLNLILQTFDANGEAVFSREDIAAWPKEDFDEALRTGLLEEASPADEVVCPGCEDACPEDVEFVYGDKTTDARAYVVCGQRDDIGRVRIPLEMLDRWVVNRERANQLRPPTKQMANKRGKTKKPKVSAANNRVILISAFLAHHRCDTDTPNWQPMSQESLVKSLGWSQPTVSRTMEAIFGKDPMRKYCRLCSQGQIMGFLKKQDDGSHVVEALDPHSDIH